MKKEHRTIITFSTTTDAMEMENYCKNNDIPGRLIPVPTIISSGCGLCWSAPVSYYNFFYDNKNYIDCNIEDVYELLI